MLFAQSAVQTVTFRQKKVWIKRDDLLSFRYSGNKLRKLYALFLQNDNRPLVSYGGPQSNAMLSIAFFAYEKGVPFTYVTKRVPKWVNEQPFGNLFMAKELGMNLVETDHDSYNETVRSLLQRYPGCQLIPQGGAFKAAETGVKLLAEEIAAFAAKEGLTQLNVALPSGTGTTALYLQKNLPASVTVYTCANVGDAAYLRAQWESLEPQAGRYPRILEGKKYPFAKPHPDLLETYHKLMDAGVEFDLVYAPVLWRRLEESWALFEKSALMVVHTGGIIGNATQLQRYKRLTTPPL